MKQIVFSAILLLLLLPPVDAQEGDDEPLDVSAIACESLQPNEICFGQASVELLADCEPVLTFDTPGELMSLDGVCVIRTYDSGMALMDIRPDTDSVFIAAVGEIEMQTVSGAAVGMPAILEVATDVYSGPGSQYAIIGSLDAGTEILVNACNCTRNWLRIVQADGTVGWVAARRVSLDDTTLPEVAPDTPVYGHWQAFTLTTGDQRSGILIQTQDEPIPLQINGVQLDIDSTAFVRVTPADLMEIDVLAGQARIRTGERVVTVPAGGHVLIPLAEQNVPVGNMMVELYDRDHIATLPLALLPQSINPMIGFDERQPTIVGMLEECNVVSDTGDVVCPLQFINPDGDDIVAMDVTFVYAPMGEWAGSQHDSPALLLGDMTAGTLAWEVSCTLAGENFIGPVEWDITLEDAAGHRSAPFRAAFNCVDG